MIGYGTEKYVLKLPPFWISNKEFLRMGNPNENKNAKANTSQFHFYEVPHHNIIPCSERREFQNNLSCSVPNHNIYNPDY